MTQYAQPISDMITGNWQTSPIWSKIDGLTADDGSAVVSTEEPIDWFECKLGPILYPDSGTQKLTVRLKRTGSDEIPVSIALMEGGTVIAFTNVTPTTSYANYSLTLSQEEIDMIVDYTNLIVKVVAGGVTCPDCLDPIPYLLNILVYATDLACECAMGAEMTLEWVAADLVWRGTGPFGKCGSDVTFELECDPKFRITAFFSNGCCGGSGCASDIATFQCNPLHINDGLNVTQACCNFQGTPTIIAFMITE